LGACDIQFGPGVDDLQTVPIGIENARMSFGPASSRLFCLLLVITAGCAANRRQATESELPTTNPISVHQDVLIDDGWRFVRSDVGSAQAVGFDDTAWQAVDLPHTWNAQDGQDGTGHYYRGPGWYRRHLVLGDAQAGRRVFLKFDAASLVAKVYVNGQSAGKHSGAFAAFCFDVTALVHAGDNVIAVRVDNSYCPDVPPLTGDFNICGGLYRDVHLLVLAPVCISPLDDGSSGIYLRPLAVDRSSAQIQVTAVLRNELDSPQKVTARCGIFDAVGRLVAQTRVEQSVSPRSSTPALAFLVLPHPHLWDGRDDPYLYHVAVDLLVGGQIVDRVVQPLGVRGFYVDPQRGFFLNGRSYPLHGVCVHQEYLDKGWATTPALIDRSYALIDEIGANAVRLAHYQHPDFEYARCDRTGIVVWAELPLVNRIGDSAAFRENARQQLRELIKQNFNHPSICFWSLCNELGPSSRKDWKLVGELNELAHELDPSRPTVSASHQNANMPVTRITDLIAYNRYFGWYAGTVADWPSKLDGLKSANPARAIGISEYGAGASVIQHEDRPTTQPKTLGPWHPEEWQCDVHEAAYRAMQERPYLWGTFVWVMFDFASAERHEGDTLARNDKGLVSADRLVRKDAFYFYKANWTDTPFVHINSSRFNPRTAGTVQVKVYSNCEQVELRLDGKSLGFTVPNEHVFVWENVRLVPGTAHVEAIGSKDGKPFRDQCDWKVLPLGATTQPG
jgi:beta-galactosidase